MPSSGRGPGVRRARKHPSLDPDESRSQRPRDRTAVPVSVQQRVLDIFQDALQSGWTPDLPRVLQEIKGHLYARDFDHAFGSPAYREAYAIRWSASRALAYLTVFHDLQDDLLPRSGLDEANGSFSSGAVITGDAHVSRHAAPRSLARSADQDAPRYTVTCLGGGGGAEVVALAEWSSSSSSSGLAQPLASGVESDQVMSVDVVDRADWSDVVRRLEHALGYRSLGPSTDIKPARDAMDDRRGSVKLAVHQGDLLDLATIADRTALGHSDLVTLMFTLNELYATSKAKTTAMLLQLGAMLPTDARLLVVDSPGSYSTVPLGNDEKSTERTYPMRWLLHHTLLTLSRDDQGQPQWEKIMTDESRWYRLPDGLRYPIDLEHTRYQIHLFRRI